MRLHKFFLLGLGLTILLACNLTAPAPTATPEVLADTFFFGYAFIDGNANGTLDPDDAPLPGAQFSVGISGGTTGPDGGATVIIPGGWNEPVTARMTAPEGSAYTLIGPEAVTLDPAGQTRAEFLFAGPNNAPHTPTPEANLAISPMAGNETLMRTPTGNSGNGTTRRDLTYCSPLPDVNLRMDLYHPEQQNGAAPAVVYIHGGGWIGGDKNDWAGALFVQELRRLGYVVASVNYRLAPAYRFPAQIEDVKCAIRYLRAHAGEYGLDPERIGVIGASAGGHLAALLGTSDASAGFDVGQYLEHSSRVQAVVDLFGPADLVRLMHASRRAYGERVFGVTAMDPELIRPFSPVTYITPDDPPFLILHGERDEMVPVDQSQALHEQLLAGGVPSELVIVRNAGHAFRPVGGTVQPSLPELVDLVEGFLEKNLR